MSKAKANGNKVATIVLSVVCAILAIVLSGVVVKLARDQKTKDVGGWTQYEIGLLNETDGKEVQGTTSIRTKKYITTDGFKVEIIDDASVTYTLVFYDKDKNFVSASADLSTDYDGSSIPATAKYVRIEVTPTNDPEVSWTEIGGYESQITVTVNK